MILIDFIVITGDILRSVNDIPIVKLGISSVYRGSLYRGSAPYVTFTGQTIVDRYIVIPQVAKAKSECMVIALTTSCQYKTLYMKLKRSRHGP